MDTLQSSNRIKSPEVRYRKNSLAVNTRDFRVFQKYYPTLEVLVQMHPRDKNYPIKERILTMIQDYYETKLETVYEIKPIVLKQTGQTVVDEPTTVEDILDYESRFLKSVEQLDKDMLVQMDKQWEDRQPLLEETRYKLQNAYQHLLNEIQKGFLFEWDDMDWDDTEID